MDQTIDELDNKRLHKIVDSGCVTTATTLSEGHETNIKYNWCPILPNIIFVKPQLLNNRSREQSLASPIESRRYHNEEDSQSLLYSSTSKAPKSTHVPTCHRSLWVCSSSQDNQFPSYPTLNPSQPAIELAKIMPIITLVFLSDT